MMNTVEHQVNEECLYHDVPVAPDRIRTSLGEALKVGAAGCRDLMRRVARYFPELRSRSRRRIDEARPLQLRLRHLLQQ